MPVYPLLAAACCLFASTFAAAATTTLHIPRPDAPDASATRKAQTGLTVHPVQRIGVPVAVDIAVRPGDWTVAEDGTAVWQLPIESADASYIGLRLDAIHLPEGAQVRLLGEAGQVRGPYTLADRDGRGRLWLPLVRGDSARLEIRAPAADTSAVRIGAAELHYGMQPLETAMTKAQGDAGDCHNDVACPQGDDWQRAIPSTALLFIGNQIACSGVLLNNTRSNGDPLLITANHCGIRSDDSAEGFPARSVQAVFNFAAAQCGSGQNVNLEDTIPGEALLYRDRRADTALIRLARTPPADFGARLAGWDASGSGAASGSGIHHPAGDLKKISLFDAPLQAETVIVSGGGIRDDSQEVEAWRVEWADGVTEGGSSGSGIWNPQQQLLGVLSGGASQCATGGLLGIGGQPEMPGPDFYGRLAFAFERSGSLGTPLRAFLDPTGSGLRRMGGIDARGNVTGPTTPAPEPAPEPAPDPAPGGGSADDGNSAGGTGGDSGGGAFGLPAGLLLLLAAGGRRILRIRSSDKRPT